MATIAQITPGTKLLLSINEASDRLGINRSYVYAHLIATGVLRSVKVGRRRLVAVRDLEEYVERLRASGGDAA